MTPREAEESPDMNDLEHALDALGQRERSELSRTLEDRIFTASRRGLRASAPQRGATHRMRLFPQRTLAMAAALALLIGGAWITTLILQGGGAPTGLHISLEEDIDTWLEATETASWEMEFASMRQELNALEQSLMNPWAVDDVILDEDVM